MQRFMIYDLVLELLKIPSQSVELLKSIGISQQDKVDAHHKDEKIKLNYLNCYMTNEDHEPFLLTLMVNDHFLHNCMLDSGAWTNVMTKKVM